MRKRLMSLLLTLAMSLAMIPPAVTFAWASGTELPCRLLSTNVTLTATHYIKYEYCGQVYSSNETAPGTNYAAWSKFSDTDKRKVTKWFAGFPDQLKEQFAGADQMLDYAYEASGWKQAGEVLRKRLADKHYPELEKFYGSPEELNYNFDLPMLEYGDRENLTAEEQEKFDKLTQELSIIYTNGFNAYQKLIEMKQKQVNAAVTSISKDLINLILDNSCPTAPGAGVDDLVDVVYDYLDSSLGIYDKIKAYTGITKLTGEDQAVSADEAAKVIDLFWQLMATQETFATNCMNKFKAKLPELEALYESYTGLSVKRGEEAAAKAEKELREKYEAAVHADCALLDLDPSISVNRSDYYEDATYQAACLAAAKQWAQEESYKASDGLTQLWQSYDPAANPKSPGDTAYENHEKWYEYYNSPKTFYGRSFSGYVGAMSELYGYEYEFHGYRATLMRPSELVYHVKGEEWLRLIDEGYENAISSLEQIGKEIVAYKTAKDKIQAEFKDASIPYRNRMYNLTQSHCTYTDEGYGNWGVSDDCFDRFQSDFESYYSKLEADVNQQLASIQREIVRLQTEQQAYHDEVDREKAGAPALYKLYADAQDALDYGLWLYMDRARKLEALQSSYPDWLKNTKAGYSFLAGGVVAAINGTPNEPLTQTFFKDVPAVADRYIIMEDQLLPVLRDYRTRELDLLADLDRALGIIKEARSSLQERRLLGSEIPALNKMSLGAVTLKTVTEMQDDFGYTSYETGEKPRPVATSAIPALIADLSGESPYMTRIRALYAEILEKRGDLLRQAKDGTLRNTSAFDNHYYKNGCDSRYTTGIYGDAFFRSYTYWSVWNYWYENIKPVIDMLDRVLYNPGEYKQVEALSKGLSLQDDGPDFVLALGESEALSVSVIPADATLPDVIWRSSDDAIAAVDKDGRITGLLPGAVTITATAVDSPSDDPISVSFSVSVQSDGCDSLDDYGNGYYLIAPQVSVSGRTATVRARLGTNGDGYVEGRAVLALYDSDGRFLGCAVKQCTMYKGEWCTLDAEISLAVACTGTPVVKVFLLNESGWVPADDYVPLEMR